MFSENAVKTCDPLLECCQLPVRLSGKRDHALDLQARCLKLGKVYGYLDVRLRHTAVAPKWCG